MALVDAVSFFATGGSGTFRYSSSRPSFLAPSQAVAAGTLADGQTVSYLAQDTLSGPTQREWGQGIFSAAGNGSITRATIVGTVNNGIAGSGSPIDFQGNTPIVSLTALASDLAGELGWVNVQSFGATGNGVTDDTASIQAAIDSAYATNNQIVYVPKGTYKITKSLFLDAPGNLRSNLTNPTIFAFSLTLMGEDGGANHEGYGTTIAPTFNNSVALWVGTGRGMVVRGLRISGPGGTYRGNANIAGVGIGISGQCSRCLVERVYVENFYIGIETSPNGIDVLADSNTFYKCTVTNCYTGFKFSQPENYINGLYDCNIGCTIAVDSSVGCDVQVNGGNPSAADCHSAALTIGSISVFTVVGDGQYTFTAVVTADADYLITPRVYNSFVLLTAHFGAVPLTFVSLVSGTTTFQLQTAWAQFNYPTGTALNASALNADLAACTTLYCVERLTCFYGNNINSTGCHIENPDAPTTIHDTFTGFASGRLSTCRNCLLNYQPSLTDDHNTPGTPAGYALFLVAISFPFMNINNSPLFVSDISSHGGDSVPVDWIFDSNFSVQRWGGPQINIRFPARNSGFTNESGIYTPNEAYLGAGIYDNLLVNTSFPFSTKFYHDSDRFRQNNTFWGWRPAPYTRPMIQPGSVDPPHGFLGDNTFNATPGLSPILWGGQQYQIVADAAIGQRPFYSIVSNHDFYSYGVNLANGTISYKGHSPAIYMDGTTIALMFPGLGIVLNDGSADNVWIVTGLYLSLGYVTAAQFTGSVGSSSTVFTPALVKQQAYSIQVLDQSTIPFLVSALPAAANSKGQRLMVSDSTLPAAGNFGGIVAGSGGSTVPVYSEGANWRIG